MERIRTNDRGINPATHEVLQWDETFTKRIIQRLDYTGRISAQEIIRQFEAEARKRCPGFTIDKYNRFAYENICKWLIGDCTFKALDINTRKPIKGNINKGLYISGGTGTGKSFLMEVLSYIAKENRFSYLDKGVYKLLFWPNLRADKIVNYYSREGNIWSVEYDADTLCIQDLGSESQEAGYMGTKIDPIKELIEVRSDNRSMITMFTSNIPLWDFDRLIERYGDRAYDRLAGECNYYEIIGCSRLR